MRIPHTVLVVTAVAATTLAIAATQHANAPLLTSQQQEVDALALSLQSDPAIKAARGAAIKRWGQLRAASLQDGKTQLNGAVDEAVYIALRAVAANDPSHPKVTWTVAPPYANGKQNVPGSRLGGDNPDRIYRSVALNPTYRYEIRGHRSALPSEREFSFEVVTTASPIGTPKVSLSSKDVDVATDGGFVITADSTPADGRRNHLYLPPGTTSVLIRDTLADWGKQLPNELQVTRLDGKEQPPRTQAELTKAASKEITTVIEGTIPFIDAAWKDPANVIKPFERKLEWGVPGGVVALNRFSVANDEALVITLDPIGRKYLGVQLTDPWLRSIDYWNRTTSLSNKQAKPNADGSFTYVLAPKDPGYYNWLDTNGLNDGIILVRWEQPNQPAAIDKAVREVRKVKLGDLASALPADAPRISVTEREKLLKTRSEEYVKRIARN